MTRRPRETTRRLPSGILGVWGTGAFRRIGVLFLAFLFASFMAQAGSAGAMKVPASAGAAHHKAATADAAGHHHHASCSTTASDAGCSTSASDNEGGHVHGDSSSACCGFSCHFTMAAEAWPLILPLGSGDPAAWFADSVRIAAGHRFERPPRSDALPLG